MNTFEKLAQIHADHGTAWAAFRAAIDDCKDIAGEISRRISEAQQRNAEWVEDLEAVAGDPERTETARRMAALEVERLKKQTFKPTTAELALYEAELRNAEAALRDARQLRTDFEAAHKAAEAKLAELRKNVVGNQSWTVVDNWISSAQHIYSRLCEEVGGND